MISGNEYNLDKIFKYLNETTNIDFSKLLPFKENINTISEMGETFIYTYGYCNICKGIVTPLFKINNEVFNYSSSKFLRFMLENNLSRNQTRDFKFNISNIIVNQNCGHQINKNISRIFITRFGSWIFEYNDIIKHYISPMNLNIYDSFSNNILFNKYEEEAYSNSINTLNLIIKALYAQEKYFKEIIEDNKLFLFKELIRSIIRLILSMLNFTEHYMVDFINKYLKKNIDKYNNEYLKLIAYIKQIYLKVVKLKLIINRIERLKINIKVIYDILNNQIPITLEENNKLLEILSKDKKDDSSKILDYITSEVNFRNESSFKNILKFILYTDENHDYLSSEFKQNDLASYIASILSSNEYLQNMTLKNGLNLATIKCKRNISNEFSNEARKNLLKSRRFASFKQIQLKNYFFKEIDKGISRKLSLDENRDLIELFDIMLIFDQSKQDFYIEGKQGQKYTNKLIKNLLEEELKFGEKEEKTFYLNNDLFSLLIKKKEENKVQKRCCNSSNNLVKASSNENFTFERTKSSDETNKNDNEEYENIFFNNRISDNKDFLKITIYFKEIENQLTESNITFKKIRQQLIKIIKKRIENIPIKELKDKKDFSDKEKKEKENNNKDKKKDFDNNDNKDNINDIIIENMSEISEDDENNNNITNDKTNNNKIDEKEKFENKNSFHPEENLPIFQNIPEFEKISNIKLHVFYEESMILQESNKIEIVLYYPKQFEALRIAYCATLEAFITSLSKSGEWLENTGGKSKASFFKTFDEKFILKNVSENEFNMFLDNGLEYFQYMSQFLFHKMPSALAKILGVYKITTKQKNKEIKYYLLLMENIFYGINLGNNNFNSPDSAIRVYDLKGSNINRYINKSMRKPGRVLLDTNYLVDFNKEPVFIDSNVYDRLKIALYNDTMYLKKLEVVDYSLLIIFEDKDKEYKKKDSDKTIYYESRLNNIFSNDGQRLIKMGIIDYIRKYTWDKKMEFYGKSLIYGDNPTIVDPIVYSDRFYKRISKYFVGV